MVVVFVKLTCIILKKIQMDNKDCNLSVVPLHNHPEYVLQCCQLLNKEWRRSDTARLHSLKSSCDQLPTSLILLINEKLIGHCKLTSIPSIENACFIESVIIDKEYRGKGFGRFLMRKAEEHCHKVLKVKTVYLSTTDKVEFYLKLGYSLCDPISIYGGPLNKGTHFLRGLSNAKVTTVKTEQSENVSISPLHKESEFITPNVNKKTYMKLSL